MRLSFLGTGTSHGIPRLACACEVCRSGDPHNQRLRPSILLETASTTVLVDATPDFRTQALRHQLQQLDAVLLTHSHADHVLGLDDLRVFSMRSPLPLYGSKTTLGDIARVFSYACVEQPAYEGLPHFRLHSLEPDQPFAVGELCCRAVSLWHGRLLVYGYQFQRALAYLTDCSEVPDSTIEQLRGITVLVLDALRHRPHPTHLTVAQALAVAARIQPKLTLLTHICHELDHARTEELLPNGVRLAYDGLQLEVDDDAWRPVP